MESVESLIQTETGPRHVVQGTFRGTQIEVVAGYSISNDEWLLHVYIHNTQGRSDRLTECPTTHSAGSLQDAFDQGLKMAVKHLSANAAGEPAASVPP